MRTHLESTDNSCMPQHFTNTNIIKHMSGAPMHIIYKQTSFKAQKLKLIDLKMKRVGGTGHISK